MLLPLIKDNTPKLLSNVPSPNCPKSFNPHATTDPSINTMYVDPLPALNDITSVLGITSSTESIKVGNTV
jgi:hypothetical protein